MIILKIFVVKILSDTAGGIQMCVNKLKPNAPFLIYLKLNKSKPFVNQWKNGDDYITKIAPKAPCFHILQI